MQYRLLGSSGLKVSELCLGTMTFGAVGSIGEDEAEAQRMYARYRAAGGNFVDTANIYAQGRSEEILGRLIARERQQVVVASKYSMSTDPQDFNAGGNSRKNLQQALETSLRRLGTDYLDVYWVHAWDGLTPLDEMLRGLDDAQRAGKILYVGFSNMPAWVVARAQTLAELRGWVRCVALQLHYSLVERTAERELTACAEALGMSITAWSPLAGGVLSGKYRAEGGNQPPGRLSTTGWGRLFLTPRNFAIATVVQQVAARMGATPSQVAVRWLMQQSGSIIPILGPRTDAQLEDLLRASEITLDAAAMSELDAASRIELGYPGALLQGPTRSMIHGAQLDKLIR
jgi:aryl-alcohol dehydrogenase-like predicted oxidoreductase